MTLIEASREMVRQARNGVIPMELVETIAEWDLDALHQELHNDLKKKVFWINIYNSCVVIVIRKMGSADRKFFVNKVLRVAGLQLSFDQIEHGILRRSKIKYSLGFLSDAFAPEWEKKLRVQKLDYRIHFALNCGANSCPPIAIYTEENLDQELNIAMRYYLEETTLFDREQHKIRVPRLFLWYFADFGGFDGIRDTYRRSGLIGLQSSPKIGFLNYDWTPNIDNFAS